MQIVHERWGKRKVKPTDKEKKKEEPPKSNNFLLKIFLSLPFKCRLKDIECEAIPAKSQVLSPSGRYE